MIWTFCLQKFKGVSAESVASLCEKCFQFVYDLLWNRGLFRTFGTSKFDRDLPHALGKGNDLGYHKTDVMKLYAGTFRIKPKVIPDNDGR